MPTGSLGFTLADRLGAKSIPCAVSGCTRTWIQMTGKSAKLGGRTITDESDPTARMCDPCREKFQSTSDVQRTCARPGCGHTFTWTAKEQMTAFATRQPPPDRLCDEDSAKMATLSNREIPCCVEGCTRNTVWSRLAQLLAGAPDVETTPTPTMCSACANVFEKLKDRAVTCGIQACKNKWSWTRDEQIRDYAAGLPNEAPRRLCESCKGVFGGIADRDVRCRTSGCKNTWLWPRESQLNASVAGKPLPKAPHRMCQRCIDVYAGTKDVERPCRRPGCKRTWTDKRGAQLARAVRGKTGDPYPHYCTECEKEVGELEDREVACKTEHCPGTWTWTAAQQLAAGVRPAPKLDQEHAQGQDQLQDQAQDLAPAHADQHEAELDTAGNGAEPAATLQSSDSAPVEAALGEAGEPGDEASEEPAPGAAPVVGGVVNAVGSATPGGKRRRRKRRREVRPPERRCDDCLAFLKDRKTREIACTGCSTVIHWPPESQLQTHLGNWGEPTLCGACKRDLTEAARVAEREALRHGGASPQSQTLADSAPNPAAAARTDESAPAETAPAEPPPSVSGIEEVSPNPGAP
jgi:hypothetical protein